MALIPCSHCGHRYNGKQNTAYPSIVRGTSREGDKQRLCKACLDKLEGWMVEGMFSVTDDWPEKDYCAACKGPDPDVAVFVTLYRAGEDREDWFGRIHGVSCLPMARMALFASTAAH